MKLQKFLLVFCIVMYKSIMYFPFVNNFMLYGLICFIIFLTFLMIFKKKFKRSTFLKFVIFFIFSIFAIINTISVNLLFPILLVLVFEKSEYKIIAKYFLISLSFFFILTIFLNLVGILPSYNRIRFNQIRYSLGFTYPGFVGLYLFFIFLSIFIAYDHEKRNMLLVAPIALIFYKLSLARAGLVGYLCLLLYAFLPKKIINSKKFKTIVKYAFPVLTIAVIVTVSLYQRYGLEELNALSSGRLLHYSVYIQNGLLTSPFGSVKIEGYTIDNYYLSFFYDHGYFGYIIWLVLNHISIKRIYDSKLLYGLFAIFLYGLFDSNAVVTSINFMITLQLLFLLNNGKEGDLNGKENTKEIT